LSRLGEGFKEKYRLLPFEKKAEIRVMFIEMIEADGFFVRSVDDLKVDWVVTRDNQKVMKIREVKQFMKKHPHYDARGFPNNLPLRIQNIVEGKASVLASRWHGKAVKKWFRENVSL